MKKPTLEGALKTLRVHLSVPFFQGAYIQAESIRLIVDEIDRLRARERELLLVQITRAGEEMQGVG